MIHIFYELFEEYSVIGYKFDDLTTCLQFESILFSFFSPENSLTYSKNKVRSGYEGDDSRNLEHLKFFHFAISQYALLAVCLEGC